MPLRCQGSEARDGHSQMPGSRRLPAAASAGPGVAPRHAGGARGPTSSSSGRSVLSTRRRISSRIFCSLRLFSSKLNMASAAFSSAVYTWFSFLWEGPGEGRREGEGEGGPQDRLEGALPGRGGGRAPSQGGAREDQHQPRVSRHKRQAAIREVRSALADV